MHVKFSRIERAMLLAQRHVVMLTSADPQLQAFVVGYLVLEIVSEFEQRIEQMFLLRAKKAGDVPVANFAEKMLGMKFRTPNLGKIKEVLRAFDPAMDTSFDAALAGTQCKIALDNLIKNRHYYVHKSGSATMGLTDVQGNYTEAVKLFEALGRALGLSPSEMASFT
jgi:hypothetical protein